MKERVERDASASASASASAQEREKIVVGGKEGAHQRQVFIPEHTGVCFKLQTWHAHPHVWFFGELDPKDAWMLSGDQMSVSWPLRTFSSLCPLHMSINSPTMSST